ncbi:RnfABCDGE type electron transport complex subunit G [[Clostridium] fimetarium]|uniref:Ion-translocating oxidoreductase complex subunit G n=1 Tax=[Clostridium] fimetarium TaxID=99656 RepID=A0A1I0QN15_9FIRM|nr:RnfABCDGE type electron transport complex subunit G [[Clostridium] fimetarium]SEW28542.1 electron transport complex protein RnfG [[Clostridium] fimetarium]
MKSIIKDSLILFIITLIGGLCLGYVYDITKAPIAAQAEKSKNAAYEKVFITKDGSKLSTTFEELEQSTYPLDQFASVLDAAGMKGNSISNVVCAMDTNNKPVGLVLTVVSKEGYGGDIKFTVGILKDGTVNGISILSISETAGLGMKANTQDFQNQFSFKNVDKFKYTKTGATADNEIDALSGATITTNAMTNGVNSAIAAFDYIYANGAKTVGGVVIEQ